MDDALKLRERNHIAYFSISKLAFGRFIRVKSGGKQNGADFQVQNFCFLTEINGTANRFAFTATGTAFHVDGRKLRVFAGVVMIDGLACGDVKIKFVGNFNRTNVDGFLQFVAGTL